MCIISSAVTKETMKKDVTNKPTEKKLEKENTAFTEKINRKDQISDVTKRKLKIYQQIY